MDIEHSFMPLLIAFAWMSGMLLAGTFLRARVRFFQKFLFPACLIGGVLGFILMSLGWTGVGPDTFALIAFHLFSLGFVSIGLTGGGGAKGVGKTVFKGSLWIALVWTACLSVQSITGAGVIFGLNVFFDPIYEGLGFLAGHGYTQGPGQTLAIASVWQSDFKIPDAVTIGLTYSAVGFFVAAFIGVPLANWGIRRGYAANAPGDLPDEFITGLLTPKQGDSAGRLTTHSANIDTVAFHAALVGVTYGLSYLLCYMLKAYVFSGPLAKLTFGFIFFYGLLVAILVRSIMTRLGISHLINDDIQRRITATTVDYLIVATMMAVQVAIVLKYIVPLSLVSIACAVITTFFILYFGRRIGAYDFERTMAIYGYCTGTAASGLLLLRIVDPQFKTPVAMEVGFMNLIASFTCTHILFLVGTVPSSDTLSTGAMMGVHAVTALVMIVLLKVFRLWGPRRY